MTLNLKRPSRVSSFRLLKLLRLVLFFFFTSFFLNSCIRISPPPPGSNLAVHMTNFLVSNPYSNKTCVITQNGSTLIPFEIIAETSFSDGSRYVSYDSETYTSSGSNIRDVTININIPSNRAWKLNITINGLQCSLCADTQDCTQIDLGGGVKRAALPRAHADYGNIGYQSTLNISSFTQLMNYPSSCGCGVNP